MQALCLLLYLGKPGYIPVEDCLEVSVPMLRGYGTCVLCNVIV